MTSGRIRRFEASALTRSPGKLKSTHGGKRPGAGRPKEVDAPIRRTVYLDQWHVDRIVEIQRDKGLPTFSEALRAIIESNHAWGQLRTRDVRH